MSKLYCPSNSSEGSGFISRFCDKCDHENVNPETGEGKKCDVLSRTMIYGTDNPNYPMEWIYGEDGHPTCTKFRKKGEPYGETWLCSGCPTRCTRKYVKDNRRLSKKCFFGTPVWLFQGPTKKGKK